jgi:hypothetical protein
MPIGLATGAKAHGLAERGRDLYETPAAAIAALLQVETLPHRIWEPAAGRGAIVRLLRAAGHHVIATDLASGTDFLACRRPRGHADAIVTNPPLQIAAAFAQHACALVPYVALLLPWRFWEAGTGRHAAARARRQVLDMTPPARAYPFANRLPMMHRDGWTGPRSRSAMAFGWFVWDRRPGRVHAPGTLVRRIRWTESLHKRKS